MYSVKKTSYKAGFALYCNCYDLANPRRRKKILEGRFSVYCGRRRSRQGTACWSRDGGCRCDISGNPKGIENEPEYKLIRDSKTLSAKQRQKAADFIANLFPCGIGWSGNETIDRVNILQASFLAMKKALSDLKRKLDGGIDIILLDGRQEIPNLSMRQKAIISGDKNIFSISAASIIAKTTRDRMMIRYHEKFPLYGFARHKGYGTKFHFEMIEKYGPCEIHRRSFRLLKKGLNSVPIPS